MRKIVLGIVASCAVIAFAPATALAHGQHHKRHHRAHHARVHHRNFGGDQGGVNNNQNENAGTVKSFTGGVLTIALNNGQTVSGQVTGDTEIKCEAMDNDMSSLRSHDRHGDNGGDNDRGDNDRGDNNRGDDQQGDNDNAMCSSTDLTTGTVVHEAELRVSSAGAVWDKVELVTASAADNDNDGD